LPCDFDPDWIAGAGESRWMAMIAGKIEVENKKTPEPG